MLSADLMNIVKFEIVDDIIPKIQAWESLFDDLEKHAILPILGMRRKELIIPEIVQGQVDSSVAQQLFKFSNVAKAQQCLLDKMEGINVHPVVIKGLSAAQYYDIPELRTTGDIDLLIEEEADFNKAVEAVLQLGYLPMRSYDGLTFQDSLKCSSRHFEFSKNNIEIEIHSRYADKDTAIEHYMEHAQAEIVSIGKWKFTALPALENGLVLLQHIKFHLTYDGVGLRLIIDWLCYAKQILTEAFWNSSFEVAARECGLEKLAICVTRMCEIYFGLPEHDFCKDADEQDCKTFMELISTSGNFGRSIDPVSRRSRILSKPIKAFKSLQAKGKREWALCHKYKMLAPVAWSYSFVDSIRMVKKSNNGVSSVIKGVLTNNMIETLRRNLGI